MDASGLCESWLRSLFSYLTRTLIVALMPIPDMNPACDHRVVSANLLAEMFKVAIQINDAPTICRFKTSTSPSAPNPPPLTPPPVQGVKGSHMQRQVDGSELRVEG